MRTLSPALTSAQEKIAKKALARIVLTHNSTTYTYDKTRIISVKETEDGALQEIEIVLDNSDKALTDISLQGYQGVLSFGANIEKFDEYSEGPPMYVLYQDFNSDPDNLTCTLNLVGKANLMRMDEANDNYEPDEEDTDSVKTLVDAVIGATLACFDHCTAYTTEWDTGYDDLADTYVPKTAFRVYQKNNRWSTVEKLLGYTQNVARVEADGKVHIFKPTKSGTTYDYEYSLESGHPFFAKALRNRLVIPNYVRVESQEEDEDQYSGTATDATSYALLPKAYYKKTYLASDDQGEDIAEAILDKAQMWCQAGSATVPMNVGAEVFDYVKVTDSREDDNRVGNIGKLVRYFNLRKNEFRMYFQFGNWQNIRKVLEQLNISSDDFENYFARLYVKDLYAENIYLDDVIDGPSNFRRTAMTAINAYGMVILDQVVEGTYGLLLATDIKAGHIKLTSDAEFEGTWHNESGVVMDASTGIALYGGEGINAFRTFADVDDYEAGTPVQVYIGTDGKFYAAGGNFRCDADAVHFLTTCSKWYYDGTYWGYIGTDNEAFVIGNPVGCGADIVLQADEKVVLKSLNSTDVDLRLDIIPNTDDTYDLGSTTYQFSKGYLKSRLKIPVGTDLYG